jgi:hypothetical protein
MGLCITAYTVKGEQVESWKPADRLEKFQTLLVEKNVVSKCECGYKPCMCGGMYQKYKVNQDMEGGDDVLKELLEKYKELILEWDC